MRSKTRAALLILLIWGGSQGDALDRDSLYIRDHYRKSEVRIAMRDGVKLFTSLYIPRDTTRSYPIILIRTPYSVAPYGPDAYRTFLHPSMLEARAGYIIAYQDVRGRSESEGTFVDVRPHNPRKRGTDTDEASDTYDTVEWLLRNLRGHNGRVGITGISYPGFYTTMGIIDAHPAVVAASPQAPIADWFIGDDDHHHGALFLAETFSFFVNFGRVRPAPGTRPSPGFRMPYPDAYRFFLDLGPLANAEKRHMRDSVPYWKDLMAHPNYDAFWKARTPLPHLTNVRPAVLTVGGWFDKEDLYGALKTYRTIEEKNPGAKNALVMGPWSHGQWNRDDGERLGDIEFGSATGVWFRENVQHPFLNAHLKGEGNPPVAEATVFETGADRWHRLDAWPPRDVNRSFFYLLPGGKLGTTEPPAGAAPFTSFVSDPAKPVPHTAEISGRVSPTYMLEDQRFAWRRPDVISFVSEPLLEGTTLAGPVEADLWVSTSGTDADWVVKVIDVFPDDTAGVAKSGVPLAGYQMLVRGDVFRGRFRESYEFPRPFTPGRITRVRFTLPDLFHRFRPKHRIMVQVQSSWFPLVDRNPQSFVNIREARETDFVRAEHRVYHSARHRSRLHIGIWKQTIEGAR